MNAFTHTVFWFIVYVLLGSFLQIIDSRKGYRLYRWWYSMTHEKPLPAEVELAFIHGQSTKRRFYIAVVLSTLLIFLIGRYSDDNILTKFVFWFIDIPALMLGFYLGPLVGRLWSRKDKMFEVIDAKIGATYCDPPPKISAGANVAPTAQKVEPAPAAAKAPPEEDPRAAIDRFTGGRN